MKDLIKDIVKGAIIGYAERSVGKAFKFHPLDLIIPTERRVRSIVGGLETSFGTVVWETLAKKLAAGNGFSVIEDNLQMPDPMPELLRSFVSDVRSRRNSGGEIFLTAAIMKEFFENNSCAFEGLNFSPAPVGKGVDVWLNKSGKDYFFDIKTVQPNIGALNGFYEQLLNWYGYYYSKNIILNPDSIAEARIVFPYNPSGEGRAFLIGNGFPLSAGSDYWVGSEFWDFCSGVSGTYDLIKVAFEEIGREGLVSEAMEELFA